MKGGAGARAPWAVFGLALAVRLAVVAWAAGRIAPVADGTFYHAIATRIAEGLGYTWLWPDGVVTYAGHYPVGYPAMVGAAYAIAKPVPAAAMVLNAVIGALAAVAAYRLVEDAGGRRAAAAAGVLVALHPGLVSYTPALMTEGVTASLVVCAAWAAAWSRGRDGDLVNSAYPEAVPAARREGAGREGARAWIGPAVTGVVIGIATLVRPQSLVLAPVFGWLAARMPAGLDVAEGRGARRRVLARKGASALVAVLAALAVCAPWTARNCARMGRCALVSYNGGWNLLIGADEAATGTWAEIKVPAPCREVFDEAAKDACFGEAARRYIAEHPAAWLALAPAKLAATFDYAGAGAWYLHTSSPAAFPHAAKVAVGAVETVFQRLALLAALVLGAWPAAALLVQARRRGDARRESGATPADATVPGAASSRDEGGAGGRDAGGRDAGGRDEGGAGAVRGSRLAVAGVVVLLALVGVVSVFRVHVWVAYVVLPAVIVSRWVHGATRRRADQDGRPLRPPILLTSAAATVASLVLIHAVFFGAGRYSLVAFPFVTALAALAFGRRAGTGEGRRKQPTF